MVVPFASIHFCELLLLQRRPWLSISAVVNHSDTCLFASKVDKGVKSQCPGLRPSLLVHMEPRLGNRKHIQIISLVDVAFILTNSFRFAGHTLEL